MYGSRIGYFSLQNRPLTVVCHDDVQMPATTVFTPLPTILAGHTVSPARVASQTVTMGMPARCPAMATVRQETAAMVRPLGTLRPRNPGQPPPWIPSVIQSLKGKYSLKEV